MKPTSIAVSHPGGTPDPAGLAETYFVLFCMALNELPQGIAAPLALDRAAVLLEMTLEAQNKPLPTKLRSALKGLREQIGVPEPEVAEGENLQAFVQPRTKSA
ncbi:hypothetical protein [Tropicimonas sp. S265A]|uniref:hypothetical protein n=1 Tax=Tropicimonas sp. S265A TaxID=3415134 RepID=UPI003C7E566A